ncbi:MAG: hypothetical protein KF832_28540 [Caldilineaceae bacterium]|nr:hypothetical protein [Caldilineaceae bacterium]
MKFVRTTPSLNGKHDSMPYQREAVAPPPVPQRTTFPEDSPRSSLRTLLYYTSRYHLGSTPIFRWLLVLLVGCALLVAVGGWAENWWLIALCGVLWVGILGVFHYWRRRDFVHFVPSAVPTRSARLMAPHEKAPVMVTGLFSVEHKYKRFTWLPGFYRTFATREHALLCQVLQKPWAGLGRWPEEEVGLWYVFFSPQAIRTIQWGELYFGAEVRPAIAITHQVELPKKSRFRREQVRDETVYLAFTEAQVGEAIWADLHHDFSPTASY